jgi:hypothetical protein
MRVLQACRDLDLPAKPLGTEPAGELAGQYLEHDSSAQRPLPRHEHPGHAAPELALEQERVTQRLLQRVADIGQKSPVSGGCLRS